MNCEEELKKAFILAWIGDKKQVEKITKECEKILSSYKPLFKEISDTRANINKDFELPKKLREKNITPEDIIQLAFFRLTKRLSLTIELDIKNSEFLKYTIIDTGIKKIIRGYCEKCKGYTYQIIKSGIGFFIQYDQIIYAETYQGKIEEIIAEIKANVKNSI
ncbi:hypothetical protein [Acidianus manzaensis]|uniref:Uncharacterized protein n=1 Tax=Acidianus manzaensis TaxID=282676 RepID=A0A1W6JXT1_9CREN|nr:hypothetical protein [Acidianus manzaensis]ARM75042.1 hypothetical protein B6F84_02690 [Acidianus manzaensis]